MNRTASLVAVFCLSAVAVAQVNLVKNGDFTALNSAGMPVGWTVNAKSIHNFKIVDHVYKSSVVMKKGVSCTPGGSTAYTWPFPLVTLEQKVTVPAGVPLELSMDLAYSKASTGTNADRSQVKAYLGGQLIATYPPRISQITGVTTEVDHCSERFTLKTGGLVTLRITAQRVFYHTVVFCHIDNVFLGVNPNNAFAIRGDRKLSKTFRYQFQGEPSSLAVALLSTGPSPVPGGIRIPGFTGTLQLSLTLVHGLWSGKLDAKGVFSASTGPFPNDVKLKGVKLWFQSIQITTKPSLGFGVAHPFAWF